MSVQRQIAEDVLAWIGDQEGVVEVELATEDGSTRVFDLCDEADRKEIARMWLTNGRSAVWR